MPSEILITPQKRWFGVQLQELSQYRDLFYYLALRDIKVRYKQTAVGALWAFFCTAGEHDSVHRFFWT